MIIYLINNKIDNKESTSKAKATNSCDRERQQQKKTVLIIL